MMLHLIIITPWCHYHALEENDNDFYISISAQICRLKPRAQGRNIPEDGLLQTDDTLVQLGERKRLTVAMLQTAQ